MIFVSDFISLIFPRICAACGNSLWKNETGLCHFCEYHLPKTNYHLDAENPVSRLFWGSVNVETGAAFLYFNKGSKVQRLVHQLKYKGRKDIGICLGEQYGQSLKYAPLFNTAEAIVPVPLHKKKFMQRGYNQSEQFAIGLSASMKIPVFRHLLTRTKSNETQTRKSRFSRYQNVKEIFAVNDPEKWKGRHLILVDDVVTTGSTLEACASSILSKTNARVSIATLATA